jgi:hypothetical protein
MMRLHKYYSIFNLKFFFWGESAGSEPKASRTHPFLRGALAHLKGQNGACTPREVISHFIQYCLKDEFYSLGSVKNTVKDRIYFDQAQYDRSKGVLNRYYLVLFCKRI